MRNLTSKIEKTRFRFFSIFKLNFIFKNYEKKKNSIFRFIFTIAKSIRTTLLEMIIKIYIYGHFLILIKQFLNKPFKNGIPQIKYMLFTLKSHFAVEDDQNVDIELSRPLTFSSQNK